MSQFMNLYVRYLNGLHNFNAQNSNAYGEKNVNSPYFEKTIVELDVCKHLVESLTCEKPHILVLTGHAGDGKTSLMYQTLKKIGLSVDFNQPISEVELPSGKKCCCIKDFSELSDKNKLEIMKKVVVYPSEGKYVFMVANTGPLINTFGKVFEDAQDAEIAKMQLINAMDSNKGEVVNIFDYPFLVINVAAIDNAGFPTEYLKKIIKPDLWNNCENCKKKSYCHILKNQQLITKNLSKVCDFLSKYYIWETEYGHRLTIRSMTEHLAYILTGGSECEDIKPIDIHKMLFFNLFFGYFGTIHNPKAKNILAVKIAQSNNFDLKRLRADEDLIIRRKTSLFIDEVAAIVEMAEKSSLFLEGWTEELRRIYFFMNLASDEVWRRDIEDIFSKPFVSYLDIRVGRRPSKDLKTLIIDAIRMMYLGTVVSNSKNIPITLSKGSGIAQSVQLVVGEINESDIELIVKPDTGMNSGKYNLYLCINKKEEILLNLPLINYFDELRNGVIATNIDPQLSHGIESLKAQLLKASETNNDELEFIVLHNKGYDQKRVIIEDNTIKMN